MDHKEKRRLLNEKRRQRRRKYGIWLDNKIKVKIHGDKRIKPITKICKECKKRRVTHHHTLCQFCWEKINSPHTNHI